MSGEGIFLVLNMNVSEYTKKGDLATSAQKEAGF